MRLIFKVIEGGKMNLQKADVLREDLKAYEQKKGELLFSILILSFKNCSIISNKILQKLNQQEYDVIHIIAG